TDGQGRTVDFRNTVVIMTSNLGSHLFREDEKPERVRSLVLETLRQTLRPEFLNRIDEIVIFKPLGREEIEKIGTIQLRYLQKRLADKRITLELTQAAEELLAKEGYDPVYGARPLKRTIQRLIQDPLALQILNGAFKEGDTVVVDAKRGQVGLRTAGGAPPVWGLGGGPPGPPFRPQRGPPSARCPRPMSHHNPASPGLGGEIRGKGRYGTPVQCRPPRPSKEQTTGIDQVNESRRPDGSGRANQRRADRGALVHGPVGGGPGGSAAVARVALQARVGARARTDR